jgi:hypothetical protein
MDNTTYIDSLINMDKNSHDLIQSKNLKDAFLYPYLPTMIIDNFYENPELWRDFALDLEFFKGNRGSWPGLRSEFLNKLDPELFNLVYLKIMHFLKPYGYTKFLELQTTFQLIDESYGQGWVHDDDPHFTVAGLIYLNPTAPVGTGTTLYSNQTDFNGEIYSKIFMDDVLVATEKQREQYSKYREDQRNHFKPVTTIENVFNRCIIFDPRTWHSADNFFGSDKQNTRLTQVFFARAV